MVAPNYLDGIAGVPQAKEHFDETARAALGALAQVALYVDDRQIYPIRYRLRLGEAQGLLRHRESVADGLNRCRPTRARAVRAPQRGNHMGTSAREPG